MQLLVFRLRMFVCRWDVIMDFSRGFCFEPADARRRFLGRCPRCWKLTESPAATWRPQLRGNTRPKMSRVRLDSPAVLLFFLFSLWFWLKLLTKHESHTSRGPNSAPHKSRPAGSWTLCLRERLRGAGATCQRLLWDRAGYREVPRNATRLYLASLTSQR